MLLATKANSPLDTVAKVVAYAKANPGKLNFGTIATGSTQNLSAELFKLTTGVQAAIVIYKTTPELVTAILRGDVDVGFDYYAAFGPSIVNKQFKVIATSGEQKSSSAAWCTDREGKRISRLCRHELERPAGPGRRAEGDRDQTQRAHCCGAEDPGHPGAHGRSRHSAHDRIAGIPERAHEERDRQMGESHPGGGRRETIARDPEKWRPVFGKDHAPAKRA